jgi:hypothetical protein
MASKKPPPEPTHRFSGFVSAITAAHAVFPIAHVFIDGDQDDNGIWTLDDEVRVLPVAFTLVKLYQSYRRPMREGETYQDELEKLPPTHEAWAAAGWEFVSTHQQHSHYVADENIGVLDEEMVECVYSETVAIPPNLCDEHRQQLMDETADRVKQAARETIDHWNKRQTGIN